MVNYESVRSLWKKWYKVEKWDDATSSWVDVSDDIGWSAVLSNGTIEVYPSQYKKLRFTLYKTNEYGNGDYFDRIQDLFLTSNPFSYISNQGRVAGTSFHNVIFRTYYSDDASTYTFIKEVTANLYYSQQLRIYNLFGDMSNYNHKYVALEIDFTNTTDDEGDLIVNDPNAKLPLSRMYISSARLDRQLLDNFLPGLKGEIDSGKRKIKIENIQALNECILPTSEPTNPEVGSVWFDPSTGNLNIWNGSAWITK